MLGGFRRPEGPPPEPDPSPSPERSKFLDAISAEPADYARRLRLADWLANRGEHTAAAMWRECRPAFYTGLDLGQAQDFSALVVVERHTIPNPAKLDGTQYAFDVRHLHRWPLKTPYPAIVADVKTMFAALPLSGSTLVVDETGVGRAVVDMIRQADIAATLRPYSITCGSACTGRTVAKKHLVGAITASLGSGCLRFAEGLALTPTLVKELENFRVTVDEATRNESYAAGRAGDNDDLVLSLSLALFVANSPSAFVAFIG